MKPGQTVWTKHKQDNLRICHEVDTSIKKKLDFLEGLFILYRESLWFDEVFRQVTPYFAPNYFFIKEILVKVWSVKNINHADSKPN